MKEARKNKERPTDETTTGTVGDEFDTVSLNEVDGERDEERSSKRPGRRVVTGQVNVKTTDDEARLREFVQKQLGTTSTAETYRKAVEAVAGTLRSAKVAELVEARLERDVAKAQVSWQRKARDLDESEIVDLIAAVDNLAEAYRERTREINYIGGNLNQLTKLAHMGRHIDTDALEALEFELQKIRKQLVKDGERDARIRRRI